MTSTSYMRRQGPTFLLALLLGLWIGAGAALAQAERMQGRFIGIAEAQGMALELALSGNRLTGRFTDSNGVTAPITAEILGNAAEAVLDFPARKVRIRLFPEAVGLRMIAVPLDESGDPVLAETNALVFVPPGVTVPAVPEGYLPPTYRVRVVDPDSFLISYPFWPPEAVAFGYESVEPRFRPMFALYPVVLMDILWKMCASTYKPGALGEALRGQGVTCAQVLAKVDQIQRGGRFDVWKAEVGRETDKLMVAVQCARGYIVKQEVCRPASREIAERAVSLQTVATVLERY